jgi:AcrR family transcriptional regulator
MVMAPASRRGLSREGIVEAAIEIFDTEGADALTMRRLADHLGVGTMTLYGYFRRKDELLDAVVDRGAARIAGAASKGSWKNRLRDLALEMRRSHLAHPAVVELRLRRPLLSRGALDVTERAMSILRDAGFSTAESARLYRLLFIFTFGFSAFGPVGREDERELARKALAQLPADRYPALVAAGEEAWNVMASHDLFEFGLDRLLDGFQQLLFAHQGAADL